MLSCKGDIFLCPLLDRLYFATVIMNKYLYGPGPRYGKGVIKLPGQGQRLANEFQGLIWIAQEPCGPSRVAPAHHTRILSVKRDKGSSLVEIVKRYPLL